MHFTHKNIVLILVAVLIVGGAFAFAEYRNKNDKKVVYSAPIEAVVNQLPSDLQDLDSDGDGLKDWEEALLGTDPHKADTDGDGTSDGAEAKAGRNPLVKGPNDRAVDTAKSATSTEQLTQTDKLARDFFAKYLELHQTGLTNDPASQAEMINQVLKSGLVISVPKDLTARDIIVSSDNSTVAIKNYGNAVATILKNNPVGGKGEASIAKDSMDQENPELLKQIDPIIATYKSIILQLKKVPAPSQLADTHLAVLNAVNGFLFSAQSFRDSDVDAIKGIQAVKEYPLAGQALALALAGVRDFLIKTGISYKPTEPGYIFTQPKSESNS